MGAALAVNRELVLLYWRVGEAIVAQREGAAWGAAVFDRLSAECWPRSPSARHSRP